MRLRQRDLQTFYLREYGTSKDDEGNTKKGYKEAVPFKGMIQPIEDVVKAEIYGEKIFSMLTLFCDKSDFTKKLKPGDCLCIFVDKEKNPDFRIKARDPWDTLIFDLELIQ